MQPLALTHPTDSQLLNRAKAQRVTAARLAGIELRRSHAHVSMTAETQSGRYAHTRQWR